IAIREAMIFPYRAGFTFVAALRRRQPWSAVDAAFARPPRSTEQVLHPERYLADDPPIALAIDAPPVLRGYTRAHDTVWGELGIQLFLRSHGIEPAAAVGIARSEWDSEADAIEAAEAAVKALDASIVGAVIDHGRTRTRWLGI